MFNNTKLSKINAFIILVIIVLIICMIAVLVKKFSKMRPDRPNGEYNIKTPLQGDAKHMNLCPSGCYRGTCQKGTGNCKYDFQCEYCADKKTNNFYVEFDNDRQILPLYEEEKHMNNKQKSTLNNMIEENNKYINDLNKKINNMNNEDNVNNVNTEDNINNYSNSSSKTIYS